MRSEKLHLVKYIGGLLTGSDYVYFISYMGLSVKSMSNLRGKLAAQNATCHVLKNTLIAKAAQEAGITALSALPLTDGTAIVSGNGDASVVAKVLVDFGKDFDAVAPKGGYFEGAMLSTSDVTAIAALPPKEVLQAQLLGVLQAPSRNLVSLLNAKAASIVNVLNAYKNSKQ